MSFIFLFVLYFFGYSIGKAIEKCMPSFGIGDIELTECLDSYWASLSEEDRKWAQAEELNSRALGMPMLSGDQFDKLNSMAMTKKKPLQGCHSYDILSNPLYFDDFQYVTAAEEDRTEIIIDDDDDEGNDAAQSDFVRVALNLAYLNPDTAVKFKFDKAMMENLKASSIRIS